MKITLSPGWESVRVGDVIRFGTKKVKPKRLDGIHRVTEPYRATTLPVSGIIHSYAVSNYIDNRNWWGREQYRSNATEEEA